MDSNTLSFAKHQESLIAHDPTVVAATDNEDSPFVFSPRKSEIDFYPLPRRRKLFKNIKSMFCCLAPQSLPPTETGASPAVYPSDEAMDFIIGEQNEEDIDKKTLVLDLDETLVHSSFTKVPTADYVIPVEIDGNIMNVYVQKRPYLDEFLDYVCEKFEVVIFTASLSKYAEPLLDLLDEERLVRWRLFREACSIHRGTYVKDLGRLGRELSKTIIVDNSPLSYVFQPGNALPISGFLGEPEDQALQSMIPVLEELDQAEDVRDCIKTLLGEANAILSTPGEVMLTNGDCTE